MRWLAGFIVGALFGAAAMFTYLYYYPSHGTQAVPAAPAAQPSPAQAPAAVQSAPAAQPAPPAPAPSEATPTAPPAPYPQPGTNTAPHDGMHLLVPVEGVRPENLVDSFDQPRAGDSRRHEAIDIIAPKGTRVLAADDGKVVKLFNSKPGGLTVYQFDPGETYAYYYAHLDRYAEGLKEGMQLKRGDLVGYVGTTGNADMATPHLHFAVFRLTPEKQWWKGTAINPYPMLRN